MASGLALFIIIVLQTGSLGEVCMTSNFPRSLGGEDGATTIQCLTSDGTNLFAMGQSSSSLFKGSAVSEAYFAKYSATNNFMEGFTLDADTESFSEIFTCAFDTTNSLLIMAPESPFSLVTYNGSSFASFFLTSETTTSTMVPDGISSASGRLYLVVHFADRTEATILRIDPLTFAI